MGGQSVMESIAVFKFAIKKGFFSFFIGVFLFFVGVFVSLGVSR